MRQGVMVHAVSWSRDVGRRRCPSSYDQLAGKTIKQRRSISSRCRQSRYLGRARAITHAVKFTRGTRPLGSLPTGSGLATRRRSAAARGAEPSGTRFCDCGTQLGRGLSATNSRARVLAAPFFFSRSVSGDGRLRGRLDGPSRLPELLPVDRARHLPTGSRVAARHPSGSCASPLHYTLATSSMSPEFVSAGSATTTFRRTFR